MEPLQNPGRFISATCPHYPGAAGTSVPWIAGVNGGTAHLINFRN